MGLLLGRVNGQVSYLDILMGKNSLTYIITFRDNAQQEVWSGFVNGWPQNSGIQVDVNTTERESLEALHRHQGLGFTCEPAWMVLEDSGSL